jgi:hypothetical protein
VKASVGQHQPEKSTPEMAKMQKALHSSGLIKQWILWTLVTALAAGG